MGSTRSMIQKNLCWLWVNNMEPILSIIIPTFNNPQYINPCVQSIANTGVLDGLAELIIVNNGDQPLSYLEKALPNTRVLKPNENLGWERGLKLGVENSKTPFLCFQNDDTHIPSACSDFYSRMLIYFRDARVAAVGPATTIASGWHSIYRQDALRDPTEVSYLIFFTAVVRRSHYEQVGGIDTECPGGDDIDLSIRFRKAGYKILVNPNAFLIHHAFKTGTRVRGEHTEANGWNSVEMIERTNKYLIQKHGFREFLNTMRGLDYTGFKRTDSDSEGDAIRKIISGVTSTKVVEMGCGAVKTVENSIGVDRVKKGDIIPHVGKPSVADITCDISHALPATLDGADVVIARHILEHVIDPISTILKWKQILKHEGILVVAVPNEDFGKSIPMNPEHVHAFNRASLSNLMAVCGMKEVETVDPNNGVSFIGVYKKTEDSK